MTAEVAEAASVVLAMAARSPRAALDRLKQMYASSEIDFHAVCTEIERRAQLGLRNALMFCDVMDKAAKKARGRRR